MRRPSGFLNEVLLSWDQEELEPRPSGLVPATSSPLELTDIGYFPRAEGHFRSRHTGCGQHIVLVCLEGRGVLRLGTHKERVLTAGDVAFIPQGSPHEYGAALEYPWTIQWVHFRGGQTPLTAEPIHLTEGLFGRAKELFSDLLALAAREGPSPTVLVALAWWLELVIRRPSLEGPDDSSVASPVSRAVRGMVDHLAEPLTLEQIAGWAALSPSWFTTVFRKEIGVPPMDHLTRLRVQQACSLLERTDLSIAEVSRAVGYPDPLHFSRVFHRRTGISPSRWRTNPRG